MFGKNWQKEIGFKEEGITKASMATIFGLSFLAILFMVWGLNFVINSPRTKRISPLIGLNYGAFMGFFIAMMTIGVNYLYQLRSLTLWHVNGLNMVVGLGIAIGSMEIVP